MNNIQQKNIVYNLGQNSELPYKTANETSLKSNQIIYSSLNYNMQKMVDNDLYNEKQIIAKINYEEGPKTSSDYVNTMECPDGYKIWNPDISNYNTELSILKNHIYTPDEVKEKVLSVLTVNFIEKSANGYIIGTSNGLYSMTGDYKPTKTSILTGDNCKAIVRFNDKDYYIATDNGIYNTTVELTSTTEIVGDITANSLQKYGNDKILVGTDTGVKSLDVSSKTLANLNDLTGKVTQITEDIKAVSGKEIYQGALANQIFNITSYQLNNNTQAKSLYVDGNKIFIVTDKGLYSIDNNKPTLITSTQSLNITAIEKWDNDVYILGTTTGLYKLYKNSSNVWTPQLTCTVNTDEIDSVVKNNNILVFGKTDINSKSSLCYSRDLTSVSSVSEIGNTKITSQITNGSDVIIASNSDINLSSLSIASEPREKFQAKAVGNNKISQSVTCVKGNLIGTTKGLFDKSTFVRIEGSISVKNIVKLMASSSSNDEYVIITEDGKLYHYDETKVTELTGISDVVDFVEYTPYYIIATKNDIYKVSSINPISEKEKIYTTTNEIKQLQIFSPYIYMLQNDNNIYRIEQKERTVLGELLDVKQNTNSVSQSDSTHLFSTENGLYYNNDITSTPTQQKSITSDIDAAYYNNRISASNLMVSKGGTLTTYKLDNLTELTSGLTVDATTILSGGVTKITSFDTYSIDNNTDISTVNYLLVGTDKGIYWNKNVTQYIQKQFHIGNPDGYYGIPLKHDGSDNELPDTDGFIVASGNGISCACYNTIASDMVKLTGVFNNAERHASNEDIFYVSTRAGLHKLTRTAKYSGTDLIEYKLTQTQLDTSKNFIKVQTFKNSNDNCWVTLEGTGNKIRICKNDSTTQTDISCDVGTQEIKDITVCGDYLYFLTDKALYKKELSVIVETTSTTIEPEVEVTSLTATNIHTYENTVIAYQCGNLYISTIHNGTITNKTLPNNDSIGTVYKDWDGTIYIIPNAERSYIYYIDEELEIQKKNIYATTKDLFCYSKVEKLNTSSEKEIEFYYGYTDNTQGIGTLEFKEGDNTYTRITTPAISDVKALKNGSELYVVTKDNIYINYLSNTVPEDIAASLSGLSSIFKFTENIDATTINGDTTYTLRWDGTHTYLSSHTISDGKVSKTEQLSQYDKKYDKMSIVDDQLVIIDGTKIYNINGSEQYIEVNPNAISSDISYIRTDDTYTTLYSICTDKKIKVEYDGKLNDITNDTDIDRIFINDDKEVYVGNSSSGVSSLQNYTLTDYPILSAQYPNYIEGGDYYLYQKSENQLFGVYNYIQYSENVLKFNKELSVTGNKIQKTDNGNTYITQISNVYSFNPKTESIKKLTVDSKGVLSVFNNQYKVIEQNTLVDDKNKIIVSPYKGSIRDISKNWFIGSSIRTKVNYYSDIKEELYFSKLLEHTSDINYITKDSQNRQLIGTEDGLYLLKDNTLDKTSVSDNTVYINTNTTEFDRYTGETIEKYYIATPESIRVSTNYNKGYEDYLGLSDTITCFRNINPYTNIIGTDKGLYTTQFRHEITDNVYRESLSSIEKSIDEYYNSQISSHVSVYHNTSSLITDINNNIMPVDFSEIDDKWTNTTYRALYYTYDIRNDLVETCKTNDELQHISVYYSNDYTDNKIQILDYEPQFIWKKYRSGQVEMIMELSTTNTYYIPHIKGCPECRYYNQKINHPNTEKTFESDDIDEHSTKLSVVIDRQYFDNVKTFFDAHINGNSLPLKIYKDTEYSCGDSGKYYHSVVLPSIFNTQTIETDNITLTFKCFGTDRQSIMLKGTTVMDSDLYLYKINAYSNNNNFGYVNGVDTAEKGQDYNIQAVSRNDAKYRFVKWSGYSSSTSNPLTVNVSEVTGDINLTANFEQYKFEVIAKSNVPDVTISGTGIFNKDGNTTLGLTYNKNELLFLGWTGDIKSSDETITIDNIQKDYNLIAQFNYLSNYPTSCEYSIPGTYSVSLQPGTYNVVLVGAGAGDCGHANGGQVGGRQSGYGDDECGVSFGGGGACLSGTMNITTSNMNLNIIIGKEGNSQVLKKDYLFMQTEAENGGDTSITGNGITVKAGGGLGGTYAYLGGTQTKGKGATLFNDTGLSSVIKYNGKDGYIKARADLGIYMFKGSGYANDTYKYGSSQPVANRPLTDEEKVNPNGYVKIWKTT